MYKLIALAALIVFSNCLTAQTIEGVFTNDKIITIQYSNDKVVKLDIATGIKQTVAEANDNSLIILSRKGTKCFVGNKKNPELSEIIDVPTLSKQQVKVPFDLNSYDTDFKFSEDETLLFDATKSFNLATGITTNLATGDCSIVAFGTYSKARKRVEGCTEFSNNRTLQGMIHILSEKNKIIYKQGPNNYCQKQNGDWIAVTASGVEIDTFKLINIETRLSKKIAYPKNNYAMGILAITNNATKVFYNANEEYGYWDVTTNKIVKIKFPTDAVVKAFSADGKNAYLLEKNKVVLFDFAKQQNVKEWSFD